MMKKIHYWVFSIIMALVLSIGVTACKTNDAQVPEFMVNDTLTADINTNFRIPDVYASFMNEDYIAEAVVLDSKGNKVDVNNKIFLVTDSDGYKITYTVIIEEKSYEKQVALDVIDSIAPTIALSCENYFILNQEDTFTIPTDKIIITDNSGKDIKASYAVTFNGQNVDYDSNYTFALTNVGKYIVTITAKDEKDNTSKQTLVIECNEKGMINNFENDYGIGIIDSMFQVATLSCNREQEYIKNGEGSLKMSIKHTNETWPGIMIADPSVSNLANSTSLSFYVFNDSNTFLECILQRNDNAKVVLKPHCWNYIEVLAQDYDKVFIPMAESKDGLYEVGNKEDIKSFIFSYVYQPEYGQVNLYFDDLRVNYEQRSKISYNLSAQVVSGEEGKEYKIPKITTDAKNAEISYKLYAPDQGEINVQNGKFIPDMAGNFVLAASCEDEKGEGYNAWYINIIEKKGEEVLLNFESKEDIDSITNGSGKKPKHDNKSLAYEGKGAAVFHEEGNALAIKITGLQEKLETAKQNGFDCVVLYAYINKSSKNNAFAVYDMSGQDTNLRFDGGMWRRIVVDMNAKSDLLCTIKTVSGGNINCDIYVDSILYGTKSKLGEEILFDPLIEDFENCNIAHTIDNKACVTSELAINAHSGELALHIKSGFSYGMFSIRALDALYTQARKNGYDKISLWVYADDVDTTTYRVWDSWNTQLPDVIKAKTWTNIVFSIGNTTKATYQFMSLTAEDTHAGLTFLVDDITFIRDNLKEFTPVFNDFESGRGFVDEKGCVLASVDNNIVHGGQQSLKVTSIYSYAMFSFEGLDERFLQALDNGYQKISFWINIKGKQGEQYNVWDLWNNKSENIIDANTWTNVIFDITGVQNYKTAQLMSITRIPESAGLEFYVDDIAFMK